MSGRGRGNWNSARGAKKARGGSAGGYSYFNRPQAKSVGSMDQGWDDDRWGYHGYQNQQWSSNAGIDEFGYEESYGNHNQMGWQNFQSGRSFGNGSGGSAGFRPGQSYAGRRGGGVNVAERKRPRESRPPLLGRAPKRRQQEPNYYGGFGNNATGGDYDAWGGGFGAADTDWMQVPSTSGWSLGAGDYFEQNEYLQDLEYEGFRGGYKQGRRNRDSKRSIWKSKKEMVDHLEKWKKKPQESPEDKVIYSKHRNLTQMEEKRNFMQAVRGVMSAMKCASETLSVEAKSESQVAEFKQQAEKAEEETTPQETNQTEEENNKTGEETNKAEKEKTEENDKMEEENDKTVKENDKTEKENDKTEKTVKKSPNSSPQVLIGVIRVGPARRKLMVKNATDHGEELVAVFKEKPQKQMLHRLASLIEFNLKGPLSDKAVISPDEATEMITVNLEKYDCKYPILISFTSPAYSNVEPETSTDPQSNDTEVLSEDKCQLALSKIRRLRWRKKMKEELELPIVRILMDFARRLPGWSHMSSYAAEVLVHSVMNKLAKDVRESEHTISRLFVQCIEVLAAGLILAGGPGLKDPCEAGSTDIFGSLKPQEAEDLTEAAQLALRMHSCGQLKKLLDV